jgi:hypothetical protein
MSPPGGSLIIVIFLIILVVPIAMLKLLGMRAQKFIYIDVGGLSMEQIVDIGTKASETALRRLRGRAQTYTLDDGGVLWNAKCNGGYVTFVVKPLADGSGFRVGAHSPRPKDIKMYGVADLTTDYGRTKFFLYRLLWMMGIPHNPRALLFRRWRGLNAIKRAGTPIAATPVEVPGGAPAVAELRYRGNRSP